MTPEMTLVLFNTQEDVLAASYDPIELGYEDEF